MIIFTDGKQDTDIRPVANLPRENETAARDFMQCVVNSWCVKHPESPFVLRDLVGKGGALLQHARTRLR